MYLMILSNNIPLLDLFATLHYINLTANDSRPLGLLLYFPVALIQRYLILQLYIPKGQEFSIDIGLAWINMYSYI